MSSAPTALATRLEARGSSGVLRRIGPFVLALPFAALLLQFACTCLSAAVLVRYPFGLDYGEGIVWQQMLNMLRGTAYGPLGTYPAIVYHYPPLFHLTAAAVAGLTGLDGLAGGRLASFAATLATSGGIAAIVWQALGPREQRPVRLVASALAALLFLDAAPTMQWAAVMRVDMLAGLWGIGGLLAARAALRRSWMVHIAALLFVAAVFTKQVSVAAPTAAFFGLLAVRPPLAWKMAATAVVTGLVLLGGLCWATGGEFLHHVLLYNVNRFRPDQIGGLIVPLLFHGVTLLLAVVGAALIGRRLRLGWVDRTREPDAFAGALMLLAFFALKTAMLPMMLKSGANTNYLVEWFCAAAALAAFSAAPLIRQAFTADRVPVRPAIAAVAILLQTITLFQAPITPAKAAAHAAPMRRLEGLIRSAHGPVIADDMVLLIRAGREVTWEPAIAAELGAQGRYDQAGFVQLVRQHRFAMFVTSGGPGDPVFQARYNPPVAAAILTAYPQTYTIEGHVLRLPQPAAAAPDQLAAASGIGLVRAWRPVARAIAPHEN